MQEGDVIAGSTFSDTPRSEAHTLRRQPFHGGWQVIDPETDMVERRLVHCGLFRWIERLHQIDFHLEWTAAHRGDVFVHVFTLADEVAGYSKAEHLDPEFPEALLGRAAYGDLLNTEHLEGARVRMRGH